MAHIYPKGCAFSTLESIKGKKITIMGLGLNGGGEACVRFLYKHGAILTVTDMKSSQDLEPTLQSLKADPEIDCDKIKFVLGCHRLEDFETADCVIKNPGVKFDGNQYLSVAKAVETDISLFLQFTKAPIIAVTGSKGKSSTVSAIYYGLKQAGFDAFLGGNITVSPLTFLEKTSENTPVVLELSSWQLSDLRGRNLLKPFISVLTLIVPDHQNWYGNMESYVADKKLIYEDQTQNQFTICNYDQDYGHTFASETKAKVLWYSTQNQASNGEFEGVFFDDEKNGFVKNVSVMNDDNTNGTNDTVVVDGTANVDNTNGTNDTVVVDGTANVDNTNGTNDTVAVDGTANVDNTKTAILSSVKVPGFHSKQNILNACLVLKLMNVEVQKIQKIMAEYKGIEHRLENFFECKINGKTINFFNDSAATVPDATIAAIKAFKNPPILITGGTDKNLDFSPYVNNPINPRAIYFLDGTATQKMLPLLDYCNNKKGVFSSLDDLLRQLKADLLSSVSESETINVVFSPGATSFGMFQNEFDRGNKFKSKVISLFG